MQTTQPQQINQEGVSATSKTNQFLYHLLLSSDLRGLDMGTFLEQMLLENLISFRYSQSVFPNSIMWLQAKAKQTMSTTVTSNLNNTHAFEFEQEFTLLYINSQTFIREYSDGSLVK